MKKLALMMIFAMMLPCNAEADLSVAAGKFHTIMLKTDGTVWTWGKNNVGQLGNGTTLNSPIPVNVSNLVNIFAIDGGESHSIALKADKTVWCWGYNGSGQLGNSIDKKDSSVPAEVSKFSQNNYAMIAVAAGQYHSAALQDDGTVWTWGYNYFSQLAHDGTTDTVSPYPASNISNATAIASGNNHLLALNKNSLVWAWGYNLYGQLGNGTINTSSMPVYVKADADSDLDNVKTIAAGYNHSFALKNDGTLWAWGKNAAGQLGDGTLTQRLYPVQVRGIDNIAAIAAGESHSLVLKNDGTVWAWGDNSKGQLGDGSTDPSYIPKQIQNFDHVKAIAAGANHSLAVKEDGSLWAWGDNSSGQLGNKASNPCLIPIQIFKAGDLNSDMQVDLKDAILSLQVLAGLIPPETVYLVSDINGDMKIGLEETVYILQIVSGLRE